MRIIIIIYVLLAYSLNAQVNPVNRYSQVFWGESGIVAPFSVSGVQIYRNNMGKRLLLSKNIFSLQSVKFGFSEAYYNSALPYINLNSADKNALNYNISNNLFQAISYNNRFSTRHTLNLKIFRNGFDGNTTNRNSASNTGLINYAFSNIASNAYPQITANSFLIANSDYLGDIQFYKKPFRSFITNTFGTYTIFNSRNMYTSNTIKVNFPLKKIVSNIKENVSILNNNFIYLDKSRLSSNRYTNQQQYTNLLNVFYRKDIETMYYILGSEYTYKHSIENLNNTDTLSGLYNLNETIHNASIYASFNKSISNSLSFSANLRSDYNAKNGLFVLPEFKVDYTASKARYFHLSFTINRFMNDDIGIIEQIKPFITGNRKLYLSSNLKPEYGNKMALFSIKNFRLGGNISTLKASFVVNDYKNKTFIGLDRVNNTLFVKQISDIEYQFFFDWHLNSYKPYNKRIDLDFSTHYKFQRMHKSQNNINQANHVLTQSVDFYLPFRNELNNYYLRQTDKISILNTNVFGNNYTNAFKKSITKDQILLDARFEFNAFSLTRLFIQYPNYINKKLNRLNIEFNIYDILSQQARTRYIYNENRNAFNGIENPGVNGYKFGVAVRYSLNAEDEERSND